VIAPSQTPIATYFVSRYSEILVDDYWSKQGRESIDAVVLFGSLLALSVLGKGFFAELLRPEREHH
jgi:hypothetical protein